MVLRASTERDRLLGRGTTGTRLWVLRKRRGDDLGMRFPVGPTGGRLLDRMAGEMSRVGSVDADFPEALLVRTTGGELAVSAIYDSCNGYLRKEG